MHQVNGSPTRACAHTAGSHAVVACVLASQGRICLLRRSAAVGFDRGKWHCVTGFLPAGTDPLEQALAEIGEETGLEPHAARLICQSQPLELGGDGCTWRIFPFLFETTNCGLCLNWENDAYRWTDPADVTETENVAWLIDVWRALDLDSRRCLRPAA